MAHILLGAWTVSAWKWRQRVLSLWTEPGVHGQAGQPAPGHVESAFSQLQGNSQLYGNSNFKVTVSCKLTVNFKVT